MSTTTRASRRIRPLNNRAATTAAAAAAAAALLFRAAHAAFVLPSHPPSHPSLLPSCASTCHGSRTWATAANMGGRRRTAMPRINALPSGSSSSSKSSSSSPYEYEIPATTAAATRRRGIGLIPSSPSSSPPSSPSATSVRLLPRKPSSPPPPSFGSSSRLYASSLQSPDDQQKREEQGGEDDEGIPPDAWRILALSFLCMIICSLDRVAMSVAILPMSLEFGYSETTKGAISSTFSLGYMASMLPAGVLATVYSPKNVLTVGVSLWSFAQILSPSAAHVGLTTLLACRFAMGAAEAVATPTVQSLVGNWFPSSIRSRVISLLASGLNLGVLLAYLASPTLIQRTSWDDIFRIYGGLGLLWLGLWVPLAADKPLATAVPQEGAEEVAGAMQKVWENLTSVPWADFIRSRALWAVTFAHMAHNYGLYVLLAWLPTYFSQTYQLDLGQSSTLSVAPWIAAAIVSNLAGWGADFLINSEAMSKTTVRKLFQCTALVIPACCMTALAVGTHTPSEAQAIFTLSVAAGSMSSAGFATATQDLADKYIGITYGATSALSVIVGSLGTFGTGVILDNLHEWPYVFGIAAGVYVAGAAAFASLYKAEKIFD